MGEGFLNLEVAHKFSSCHREQVLESETCGCFYCKSTFAPALITEWVDEDESEEGQTALCPKCGIDSVIGDKCGIALTADFLNAMHNRWF